MVLAALIYSLRYFDAVGGLFHGLMLLFMAGMVGFCLTGDLFDLVVFFELMSAVAYALTAYRIEERAPIQGAINFAITNSIAGYAMFIAVALLYARTGALNMAQIGAALDGHHADPLVIVAMVLLLLGFLTKAAAVPLHFWLADAHAVAPIPVCVLFSGVMVELGIYAVARLYWVVFAGPVGPHAGALRAILVALGVMTALLGAWMCFLQRHIKRLLAFSTISHVGVFVCGIGLLSAKGAGRRRGLHRRPRVDQGRAVHVLRRAAAPLPDRRRVRSPRPGGRRCRLAGVLFVAGGLLLAAPPPLTEFAGKSLHRERGVRGAATAGWRGVRGRLGTDRRSRAAGGRPCVLGWGPSEGPDPSQARAAHERVDETREERDHTPPLMLIVPGVLLAAAVVVGWCPERSRGWSGWRRGSSTTGVRGMGAARPRRALAGAAGDPRAGARRGHRPVDAGGGICRGRRSGSSAGRSCAPAAALADGRPRGGAWPAGAALRPHRRLHRLVDDRRRRARRRLPARAALSRFPCSDSVGERRTAGYIFTR